MDSVGLDALLLKARRRDPAALAAIVEAYSRRVFGLLFRLTGSRDTAEDLTQETFLRLVRTIEEYQHDGRFEAWLFRIASNLVRDQARQRKRRGPTMALDAPDEDGESAAANVADAGLNEPAAATVDREDERRLLACIEELPESDREILLLRHYSQLSFREIAEMLNIPLGTALARAHRAVQKLREGMGEAGVKGSRGQGAA
ncbi:MAG: RNA polymerase sigma factor [Phycisphaerae bacterium]